MVSRGECMTDPKHVAMAWIEAINAHDPGAIEAVLHDEFTWELGTSSTTGAAVSAKGWRLWFEAFPDFRFELIEMISQGQSVCARLGMSGTHRGLLRFRGTASMDEPIGPSDRVFSLPGCSFLEIDGDRVRHLWAYWDTATLMRQIAPQT
jgi:predicted ester cyclase